jgi:hypothetical protein
MQFRQFDFNRSGRIAGKGKSSARKAVSPIDRRSNFRC